MTLRTTFKTALLFMFLLLALPAVSLAQTSTPIPQPVTLIPGQTVRDSLTGGDAMLSYTIPLPRGQDVIFEFNSDAAFFVIICLGYQVNNGSGGGMCTQYNDREGDNPVSLQQLISSTDLPDRTEQVSISVSRHRDSAAHFNLTAYALTPREMDFDSVYGQSLPDQPYQSYTLTAADDTPFSVEIEEVAAGGNFLWAAYLPKLMSEFDRSPDIGLPMVVDEAGINGDPEGIQMLRLLYLGAETYRVLVRSGHAYALHTALAADDALPPDEPRVITASYQRPVVVIPLALNGETSAQVDLRLLDGAGASVIVQGADDVADERAGLGKDGQGDTPAPTEQSLTLALENASDAYIIVQIPAAFTRSSIRVEVRWSAGSRG